MRTYPGILFVLAIALLVVAPVASAADEDGGENKTDDDEETAPSTFLADSDPYEGDSPAASFTDARSGYLPSAHFQRELLIQQMAVQGFFEPLTAPPRIRGILEGPRDVVGPMTLRMRAPLRR